jgi:hypothetical protein
MEPVFDRAPLSSDLYGRWVAHIYQVPAWLIGIGKRPPKPKVRGQRGTGHHRPHRRK